MDQLNIQWYPGHMTKARRMMEESLHQVDALCEILDARIPNASRNPEIDTLAAGKPRLVVLNRADLADPALTKRWKQHYEDRGFAVLDCDARTGKGCGAFAPAVRRQLAERLDQWREKGQTGRRLRVMVAGIPNVGKSTFINRVAGRKAAAAGDKPGVTRGKQWIAVDNSLELLDTPGILWPKFEDPAVGELRGPGSSGGPLPAAPGRALSGGGAGALQAGPGPGGRALGAAGARGKKKRLSRLRRGSRHRANGKHPAHRVPQRETGQTHARSAESVSNVEC